MVDAGKNGKRINASLRGKFRPKDAKCLTLSHAETWRHNLFIIISHSRAESINQASGHNRHMIMILKPGFWKFQSINHGSGMWGAVLFRSDTTAISAFYLILHFTFYSLHTE